MKNLFNNIDSSEKDRILEMHKKHSQSLFEQNAVQNDRLPPQFRDDGDRIGTPGMDDDAMPADYDIQIPKIVTLDGSLFKNGIAQIDKNNPSYKEAIKQLKSLPSDMSVNIIGGASNVGTKEGYDNNKLAMLRATNFIKAAQSDGITIGMTPSGEVGVATIKNSPDAEKEQFVKIDYTKGGKFKGTAAVNTTRTDKKNGGREIETGGGGGGGKKDLFKMCLKNLTAQEYNELKNKFLKLGKISSRSVQ
jgi:hypothetical protein